MIIWRSLSVERVLSRCGACLFDRNLAPKHVGNFPIQMYGESLTVELVRNVEDGRGHDAGQRQCRHT